MRDDVKAFEKKRSLAASSLYTFYHETTHAYFFLIQYQNATIIKLHPTASRLIEDGIKYYEKAPLMNGKKADDPERVFLEAAASYVGDRAAKWIFARGMLDSLLTALNANTPIHIARETLQKTINEYNKPGGPYGYQDAYSFLWFGKHQVETTKPIMPQLKIFLDTAVLEGKIPPVFNSVQKFREMVKQIKSKPPFLPSLPSGRQK